MAGNKFRVAAAVTAMGVAVAGLVSYAEAQDSDALSPLPRVESASDGFVLADGTAFTPRGNNYVRLTDDGSGTGKKYHSTFEPGVYDAERAETALARMSDHGYNTVRVFIDYGDIQANEQGRSHGLGRGDGDDSVGYAPYYDNVADFVTRAAAHGIYVLPSLDIVPFNAHYQKIMDDSAPIEKNISGRNVFYMQRAYINAKADYVGNFVEQLRDRVGSGLMSTFLALATDNEATFEADQYPFSMTGGTVTGPDGVDYDMAEAADRRQIADASLVVYTNTVAAAVREADPDMLVTTGMFTHRAVGKQPDGFSVSCSRAADAPPDRQCQHDSSYYRYPPRPASLSKHSTLSFLDIHLYPNTKSYVLKEDLDSSEWDLVDKTTILGEYGAMRKVYDDVGDAAYYMRKMQKQTCALGLDGWLFWTWDTDEDATQLLFYRATEGDDAVNGTLGPAANPDPCT